LETIDCRYPTYAVANQRLLKGPHFAPSFLRSIEIECNTFTFSVQLPVNINTPLGTILPVFITPQNFSYLREVTLYLSNVHMVSDLQMANAHLESGEAGEAPVHKYVILNEQNLGHCTILLAHLNRLAPTLNTLDLCICDHEDLGFLSFVSPLETLVHHYRAPSA
jgi:hypothetical protein